MKLKLRIFALMAMLLCFAFQANAQVAKIGETTYSEFGEALTAAGKMSGDVTVEVYDKVTLNTAFSGSYSSINFVGKDTDAEIYLEVQGYITATGKKVSFTDLTLSKSQGAFITDAGFMNVAFGVYDVVEVAYTNCVFANGAYASSGNVTYTGCTFKKSWEKYGLWAYGNVDVTVDDCKFDNDRGIKMYAESAAKTVDLIVKNSDFTALTGKPAIVLTYGESVVLEGNTYSSTGTFELDLDGDPNGTAVTSDVAPVCVNDSGACGVLVDGKIYKTAAEAAAVATEGSNVTLLYSTTDAVEFAEGVNLALADNVTADNVTVKVTGPVEVADFEALKAAVEAGKKVKLIADITTTAAIKTNSVTSVIDLNGKTLTIGAGDNKFCDTSNITIKNGTISITGLTVGGNAVFCLDEYEKTLVTTLTLDNVNLVGDGYSSAYCIFYIGDSSVLNVKGGVWNLKNDASTAGGVFKGDASAATLNIDGLNLTAHNVRRVVTYAATTIENSTLAISGDANGVDAEMEHGFNRSPLAISNSTITMTDMVGRGITAANGAVTISENSTVTMTNCQEATIDVRNDQTVTIDNTSTVKVDKEPTITSGTISGTVKLPAVAKIGDEEYTSLQEALNAAAAGTGNVTVTILDNVDLTGVTWTPVTVSEPGYPVVTVEGNNKTITGLTDMLFAGTWAGGSGLIIKNLTIADSEIVNDKDDTKGNVGVGAFIGYPQASATITLENCHLKNSRVEGGHWTGGLIGMAGGYNGNDGPVFMNLTIKGCSVTGSTITGKGSAGGVIGHGSCAAWTNVVIEETTVSGNTITSTGSSTNKAGAVMGTIGAAGQPTTANGETMTGGASVSATVAGNTVTSNGTAITTIYGRQGTATGMLYVAGGSYDKYPIEENVSYAAPIEGYEIVENTDGTFGIQEAKEGLAGTGTAEDPFLINNVDDLVWFQEKVDEQAADGSTQFAGKYFKLTADIDLAGINWNPIGSMSGDHGSFKGVFDGGDHTISNLNVEQAGNGIGLFARTAGNAVIKNLKLNNVTVKSTDNSNYVGGVVGNAYASTKIENVHVSGNVYISGRGYIGGIAGHGYVVMDNVSVVATGDGQGNGKGLVTSTFWCAGGVLGYAGEGATNIMNAKVENVVVTSAAGGLGAIVGMAEDNNGTQPISGSNLSASNVEIKTYTGAYGDSYSNYALGYLYGGNPTSKLTGELKVENVAITTSNGVAPEVNDAVASIDGAIYFNLASAVAAADGKTITMLRNVELASPIAISGKTITLDLNGKTVSMEDTSAATAALIKNNGNLTITDGTEDKAGKLSFNSTTPSANNGYASNTISNYGTITVVAGTIENTTVGGACYALDNYAGSTATINGGKLTAEKTAVRIFNWTDGDAAKATLNVNGGEIYSKDGYAINVNSGNAPAVALNITGGTITTDDTVNLAVYVINKGTAENFTASVTGGTFNGYYALNSVTSTTMAEGAVSITNGTFDGVICYDEPAYGFISGGTYACAVNDYCAYGYVCEANEDGTYGVVASDFFELVEGVAYTNNKDFEGVTVKYSRTLSNEGKWYALYLPVEIPVSFFLDNGYSIAEYSTMHSYDDDEDDVIDRMTMEVKHIKNAAATLKANYPYFIRANSAEAQTLEIELTNTTLYAATSTEIEADDIEYYYTLTGTYEPVTSTEDETRYILYANGVWDDINDETLKPFRHYLTITSKDGSDVILPTEALKAMRIVARGEEGFEGTTGVETVETPSTGNDVIYDLSGRPVEEPVKGGMYIINGKKVVY